MTTEASSPRPKPIPLIVTVGLAAVVGLSVANGRRVQSQRVQELSSPSEQRRDAAVRDLLQNERLVDVLTATQNTSPDADKDPAAKAQNAKSLILRQNAAASAQRVIAAGGVPEDAAFRDLFALRKDADGVVKDHATDSLVFLGKKSPDNLQTLVARLGDGDPDARAAAGDALVKIGGDSVAKAVDALEKSSDTQDTALGVSGRLGDAAVPYAAARLSDSDISFRAKMATLLGQTGSALAVAPLIEASKQDDPAVQRAALLSLSTVVQAAYHPDKTSPAQLALAQAAEPTLIAALAQTGNDAQVRSQASLTLGRFADNASITALIGALKDDDNLVRLSAVSALQSSGTPAAEPLLAVLNGDGSETERSMAAQALGGIGAPSVVAALAKCASPAEVSPVIRRGAVMGLGQTGDAAAVPTLVASLEDSDIGVSSAAADALLAPSFTSIAIPGLIAEFSHAAPAPFNASRVLARMGVAPIAALKTAIVSPDASVQTWAAITLGQSATKDPSVVASLDTLKQSPNETVRYAADQALLRISEG